VAANPTWAIRLQIEDRDSGFPLVTTRLRDKGVLIKLIGFTLGARHAGINRKASIDCREFF
jgi:hypothetical protein